MHKYRDDKNLKLAYLFLRLTMGFNMFAHGIVRLPKLNQFSDWMVGLFQDSLLPSFLVIPFSYMLPVVEFLIGVMLIVGFKTPKTLLVGACVIMSLIFGSCLIEKWDMAGGQMVYALFFFVLSATIPYNAYSLDNFLNKGKTIHA